MERRDTEIISGTDSNLVGEVQQEYYNVLRILIDPELQPLKSRISMLYQNLTEHIESEENHIRRCKMNKSDIDNFVSRISSCNRVIEEENMQADNIKKDLEKLENQTQGFKKKENNVRENISRLKLQMNLLQKDEIKGLQEIQIKQQNEENQLKKQFDKQMKIKQELQTKNVSLMAQQKFGIEQIAQLQKKNSDIMGRIDDLREKIKQIEIRDTRQKRNNDKKKEELNRAKIDKDALKQEQKILQISINQLDQEIQKTTEALKDEKIKKDEQQRVKNKLEKQSQHHIKQFNRKIQQIQKLQSIMVEKQEQLKNKEQEYQLLNHNKLQAEKNLQLAVYKLNQIRGQNGDVVRKKQQTAFLKKNENDSLEKLLSEREKLKGKINQLFTKKLQKDKSYKLVEHEQHKLSFENVQQINKLKKIRNQVASYQVEQQKLSKILQQIKKQQEKYGIQASHAHSKYYQIMEELRFKNTKIQNLKRQNQEVQNKCKHQQNLYEAVRSDRNLYSKDFIKSKDEINELKKKYKRMTYGVQQLREQIRNKDQKLVDLDKQFKRVESQNIKNLANKNRIKSQISSTQQVIKNQQNHVGHLKKIIQQAQNQKGKQQKDYDMVRNQRDILGTQLIKRNQQLAILYQKIKLSNSNLTKGQIYYKQKEKQLNQHRLKLITFRNQFLSIDEQIRSIEELKAEISFKEKQLLGQKAKVKALQDELTNPMNVHRWRKLQATDQDNYERILKIQTLQRRLISKTEQVQAKQSLIRDKQKLFLQLKNILSRQPGAQVHEQLIKYKQALKQKSGQMKKMKIQLQDAHQQMGSVKYEVDRIKNQILKMKKQYFELRQTSEKEVINERNFAQEIMDIGPPESINLGGIEITTLKK